MKYRIIRKSGKYIIQYKFLLWWENVGESFGVYTRYKLYDTEDEAKEVLEELKAQKKDEIVYKE